MELPFNHSTLSYKTIVIYMCLYGHHLSDFTLQEYRYGIILQNYSQSAHATETA
jgi:hypothetical protein